MTKKSPELPDPFSLFGNVRDNNPFEDWDPYPESFESFDYDSTTSYQDPFATTTSFPTNELQVQHRRTTSSPPRAISPYTAFQNKDLSKPQLQVAMSTCELQKQQHPFRLFMVQRQPFFLAGEITSSDEAAFYAACSNPNLFFNPLQIGFIPMNFWEDRKITFGECVTEFFQRKNNAKSRFAYKLFNALCLAEFDPIYTPLVGVKWLNDTILRVDKKSFARLLGIKSIDGSLFHQQGNFPSHGFFEIGAGDVSRYCPSDLDFTDVDFENVRLLIHTENLFKKGCTKSDIENCRWANGRK